MKVAAKVPTGVVFTKEKFSIAPYSLYTIRKQD